MTHFVLDASVTLAWFIDPSVAPLAVRVQRYLVQGDHAIVPHLWRPEVANGLVIARKRGVLTPERLAQAFAELDSLLIQSIESVSHDLPIQRIATVAQQFELTAYDASYIETAHKLQLPLATLDRRLAVAAGKAEVSLIS